MKGLKILLLIGCAIFIFIGYFVIGAIRNEFFLPSDQSMERRFEENIEAFEKLKDIFKENSELSYVSRFSSTKIFNPAEPTSSIENPLPESKMDEYRKLFKHANVGNAMRERAENQDIFFFSVHTIDMDSSDYLEELYHEKGYVYSESALSPLLDSLDDERKNGGIAYKKLRQNWYLFYRMGVRKPE